MDTSGIHLSLFSDSSPSSLAWTVISSAPPGTSTRSSRRSCESATAGLVESEVGVVASGPSALLMLENIGVITSRKAKIKLAVGCQRLNLWNVILLISNMQQYLADGAFVL